MIFSEMPKSRDQIRVRITRNSLLDFKGPIIDKPYSKNRERQTDEQLLAPVSRKSHNLNNRERLAEE